MAATLMTALFKLEMLFHSLTKDVKFKEELAGFLKDYVSEHYTCSNGERPDMYFKRGDLNHTGAHKINNAIAQALLAKRLDKNRITTETGVSQYGVATATA